MNNQFECNYIEPYSAGTVFTCDSTSGGNRFNAKFVYFASTVDLVNDANTTDVCNYYEHISVASDTGGTGNVTYTAKSRFANNDVLAWGGSVAGIFTNNSLRLTTGSVASSATPAINTDLYDEFDITALAANITSMTTNLTGTPRNGQKLLIRIKDNGTARTITWGASFASSGTATLLATTAISKTHTVGLVYNSTASKWYCLAVDATGY